MKRAKEGKSYNKIITILTIIVVVAIIVVGVVKIYNTQVNKDSRTASDTEYNSLEENSLNVNQLTSTEAKSENTVEVNIVQNITNISQAETTNTVKNETVSNNTKPVSTTTTGTTNSNSNKTTNANPTYKNSGTGGLPVLMYHFFYNAAAGETGRDNNFMEISAFESQMKYLSDNNFYFPTWQEVEDYIDGKKSLPAKSVVITVDDGDESFFRLALPVIEKYNVKATEFLVTSWNGWYCNDYKSSKMSYQSHSDRMHQGGANGKGVLLSWSYDQIYKDLTDSKNCLNGEATVFCYPFGQYNENSKKILKDAGYKLAFTTAGGRVYKGADKYALPRVRMSKGVSIQSFANMVN